MRCFYCTRQEHGTGDRDAVAICKRCGGAICLEHLCEVRRDRRHAGMLGQPLGQSVEMLCLACAGLNPAETRRPAPTGQRTGSESERGASNAMLSSSTHEESEPAWADPAGVVVAAETYLARLRAPTRPLTGASSPTIPGVTVGRRRWVFPSRGWWPRAQRWFVTRKRHIASRMGASPSSQR